MMASYQTVVTHGGVAAADPHRLIIMLMDGVLERLAQARGCMERGAVAERSQHLHRAVSIIDELRNSLDLSQGEIAHNLDGLYDYMCRQLLTIASDNRVQTLDEVGNLMREVRGAWITLPASARAQRSSPP
jgi:flagellar protein FliS